MLRMITKSEIRNAIVTEVDLQSNVPFIKIDSGLLEKADILIGEKLQVINQETGVLIELPVGKAAQGSGVVLLSNAASRYAQVSDKLTIVSYCLLDLDEISKFSKKVLLLNDKNRPIES